MTEIEDRLRSMLQTRSLDVTGPPPARARKASPRFTRPALLVTAAAAIVVLVAGLAFALHRRTSDVEPSHGCSTSLPGAWRRALDNQVGPRATGTHALAVLPDGRVVLDDAGSISLTSSDGSRRTLATLDNPVRAQIAGAQVYLYTPDQSAITYLHPPYTSGSTLDQPYPISKFYIQDGLAYLGFEHGRSGRPEIWIYHLDASAGLRAERPHVVSVPDLNFFLAQPGFRIEETVGRYVYAAGSAHVVGLLRTLPQGSDYAFSDGYFAIATPSGQLYRLAPDGTRRGPFRIPGHRALIAEAAVGDYLVVGTDPEHLSGPVFVLDTTTGASADLGVTRSSDVEHAIIAAHYVLAVSTTRGLRVVDVSTQPHLTC